MVSKAYNNIRRMASALKALAETQPQPAEAAETETVDYSAMPGDFSWVPNIDCDSIDPEDIAALADLFSLLAAYARNKAIAMHNRKFGAIPIALEYERTCERLYNMLPKSAKW